MEKTRSKDTVMVFYVKKVLFWDFDGTLIQPNESFADAFHKALEDNGYFLNRKAIKTFMHATCSWYFPDTVYPKSTGEKWWGNLFKRFDVFYQANHIDNNQVREAINASFKNNIWDCGAYHLYPDTIATLRLCEDLGFESHILSNNYPELPQTIMQLGMGAYFRRYFISSNIGYEKPRPEIFKYALQTVSGPAFAYMIGDNPVADIQGGKAAGMRTILVHASHDVSSRDADFVCDSLMDIPKLLS